MTRQHHRPTNPLHTPAGNQAEQARTPGNPPADQPPPPHAGDQGELASSTGGQAHPPDHQPSTPSTSGRLDTPPPRPPRAPYRNKGRIILNSRDEWMMEIIAQQGGMRYDQIGIWLAFYPEWQAIRDGKPRPNMITDSNGQQKPGPLVPLTQNAVRRVISRWFAKGFAASDQLQDKKPMWLWMLNPYMSEYGQPYAGTRPPKKKLNHLLAINSVRLTLARSTQFPKHTWRSERDILLEQGEAVPGVSLDHPADGALILEDGSQIGIEVERTSKEAARIGPILLELVDLYPQIYYFTTETVEKLLATELKKLSDDQQAKFTVYPVLKEKED